MIDKKKVVMVVARFVFIGVFLVVSIGFLMWEVTGLINWPNGGQKSLVSALKRDNLGAGRGGVVLGVAGDEIGNEVKNDVIIGDARPLIIKKYLEKYKSPLAPYSDLIFELSELYGYDYRWIVAIAQQESNLCKKIPEDSYNCWGYGIHKNGTLKFQNYELALRSYAEYLKRSYFDKGLNTPELIMHKYCPSSNGSWAYGVTKFMDEMENLE